MKLHLPVKLYKIIISCYVFSTLTVSLCAAPYIPVDYSQIEVNVPSQFFYSGESKNAYRIHDDIVISERFRAQNAYFFDADNATHGMSITGIITAPSSTSAMGGAIYETGFVRFCDLSYLTISDNSVSADCSNEYFKSGSAHGGAVYNSGDICFDNVTYLKFESNAARPVLACNYGYSCGGAIYNKGTLTINNNDNIHFLSNSAEFLNNNTSSRTTDVRDTRGGAIYSSSDLSLVNNKRVHFSDNLACTNEATGSDSAKERIVRAWGGAMYLSGNAYVDNNKDLTFKCNIASSTSTRTACAAPYAYASGANAKAYGGALVVEGSAVFQNNSLEFTGNEAKAIAQMTQLSTNGANYMRQPSLYSYSYGGAAYVSGSLGFISNNSIIFSNNSTASTSYSGASYLDYKVVSRGGAIYGALGCTGVTIAGNQSVEFRGNYEWWSFSTYGNRISSQCRLRSIYMNGGSLILSAPDEGKIVFYDTIYAGESSSVYFNPKYQDADGNVQDATGDIVFSGKYVDEDLASAKLLHSDAAATSEEIIASKTNIVLSSSSLYGGRLIVEDTAILEGQGITAAANSGSTVRVKDGTLKHSGYALTFNTGTTLEAEGVNAVTADSVDMLAGSTLSFVVGEANLTTAALTLTGNLTTDTISVAIGGLDALEAGNHTYALMKASTYNTAAWTADKITVATEGVSFDDLVWDNGTLYLNYSSIPDLTTATWSNASGDGLWNASSINWTQDGYSYAYADGVDVIFGNDGAGMVSLVGNLAPKSVLINNGSSFDYTFAGTGKLTGTTDLTKQGEGKLTINTANDYTGGTVINGGTVLAGNDYAFGNGVIELNGGNLNLNSKAVNNAIKVSGETEISGGSNYQGALSMVEGGHLTLKDGLNLAQGAQLNGGMVTADSVLRRETLACSTTNSTYENYGGVLFAPIYGEERGLISMEGNSDISFTGNTRQVTAQTKSNITAVLQSPTIVTGGSAIYGKWGVNFSGNDKILFENNRTEIKISVENIGTGADPISVRAYTRGIASGAVRGNSLVNLSGNKDVVFRGNEVKVESLAKAASGQGVAYAEAAGGAMDGASITMLGNDNVLLENNIVEGAASSGSNRQAQGTSSAIGGAVYASSSINIKNNDKVIVKGNATIASTTSLGGTITASTKSMGGAIYTHSLTLTGNGDVLFSGNYEKLGSTYRLRSVYATGASVLGTHNSIVFEDSFYVGGTLSINDGYSGDIHITGEKTAAMLEAIKGTTASADELKNSLTSEHAGLATLYGGRLIVEDGAILKGQGITAVVNSGAMVRVKDGTLNHSGYTLTFNNSTKLEAEGVNAVTAKSVDMKAGSTLSFVLGEANLTTAALTLTGTLTTETISVAISGLDELEAGRYTYALMKASTYNTSAWTADKITVATSGVSFDDLVWDNGTLYLNYANLPALTTATWNNGSGDGLWNAASLNWTQDGYSYAYADGVDVIFGNDGAGTVSLVGNLAPKSVLINNGSGFDYTFAGEGKLTGATALTKQGEGKLTINTANDYTGGTAINGGTLVAGNAAALGTGAVAVNGGTLEIAASGFANDTSFAGTSALVVDAGYQLALSKMLANSGVLTVSGTLNASSLTLNTTAATHIDVNGNSGASGFAKGAIYSVQVVNGGTTSGADATITHLNLPTGETLVLGENGVATAGGSIDYSEYLLTDSSTASTSAIHAKGATATVTQNGGTLAVDDTVTVTTTGGTIVLNSGALNGTVSGATINATSGELNAALSGNNTLNGTNYALQSVIANSGALTVSGTINAAALTLDTTAATRIDVNGNSGASGFAKDAIYAVTIANGTTVNSGATITHGEHTLTLGTDGVAKTGGAIDYSEYLLTGSATAATSAIHAKGASATVTQNGGTLTVDDAVTVATTGGTIALNGGTLNGAISGATINATSGALNAALSGNNTLNGTNYALQSVIANSGVLTVSGTINAAALTLDTTAATHIDVNGNSGASGFAKDAIYAVTLANGTTVNSGATITHGEHTLTLGTDGVAKTGGAIDYSEYLLTGSATAATSAIHAKGASATVTQNGGTLTVDDAVTVATTGGTIALNGGTLNGAISGATINATSGALNAALSGNNTLNGTNYALQSVIANSGALTVSGTINAAALTLDTTAATRIDVNGNSGTSGFAKDAIYAVTIANGTTVNSGATITHGEHTLTLGTDGVAKTGGAIDYSEYLLTGSATAATSAIHAKGASATVTQNGGTLTVDDTISVTTTGGTIALSGGTLNGTVSGATINATEGSIGATLSGNNTLNGTNYALQSVIANSGTLTVSGTINAAALTLDTTAATRIDVNGNSGTSGFAKDAIYAVTIANGTTVNSGATITHGEHTLTLGTDGVAQTGGAIDYSEYLLTGSATAATSAIHAKGASATVTQNGGTLTVDDAVTVATTGGAIALNGGALNGAISGATINATSGALNATLSGNNTLNGTNYALQSVIANSGALTVSGTINAAALTLDTTAATYIDVNGNSGTSGFAKDAIYAVTIANGTTVNSGATITHGEHTLTLGTDGVAKTGGAIDYSEYLLTGSATAATSSIHAKGATATVTQNGGTLTVDDAVTVATAGGTIVLNSGALNGTVSGATINAASGTIGATLNGNNTLNGTNYALQSVIANSGALTVSGTINAAALTLDTTAATHIDVNGNSGASGFAKDAIYAVTLANGTTVNSGATITHGEHTLTLGTDGVAKTGGAIDYSEYLLTGSATAATSAIHAKGASATVTQNGGTLTVDDAVTVTTTAGNIALSGGALNGAVSGATINATSGALNAALSGNNTLNGNNYALGNVLSNAGALTISGTISTDALTLNKTDATHINVAGASGANGFAKTDYYEVQLVNGGSVVNSGATITHTDLPSELTLALGTNGIANAGGVVDYSNYLLVDATASVSAIHGVAGASAATITQQGGTLTVDGDATVATTAGNIALTSGTLSGTISGASISSTTGAATIAAAVSGASSVSVDGGSLTLAGANTYTGATTVTAGTLTVTGSVSGNIALIGGTLNTGSGMTLSNQSLALQGGSVAGNLALGAGSLLSVEQVSEQTGNLTLQGGTIALSGKKLTLSGALNIGAVSTLRLESGYTQEGEYELLGYGSLSGDLKQLQLAAISTTQETRQNYTLSSDGSVLKLTVDGNALVLNWAGGDGTWQSLGSTEWLLPESVSAADKRFHENDSVVFATGGNVTLVGELKPTAVTVGGTQDVTFGGSGSIVGATTLTKEGSSTLTMNATNAYTGGTSISEGVVNAGGAASFGSGEIALQGGELNLGNHAVANVIQATGGKLSGSAYAGTAYVNGAVSVGDATQLAALVLNGGSISGGSLTNTAITANNGTINSAITGSSAVVSHGTVTLAGTNTYTGDTTIDGGELTVTGSVASDIHLTAGVLNTAAGMTLASGQTLYMAGGSVTGDLSLSAGSRAEVNAATTITGGLTLNGGTLAVSDKLLMLTGTLTVGAESVLDVSGYTTQGTYTLMQYAGLSGDVNDLVMPVDVNGTSRLNYTLSDSGTSLVLTLDGNALTLTWKGGDGIWGTLADQEWDLPEGVSVANARFYAADSVVFTKGGTVTVSGEVMPGDVLVDSAETLTLIGSGSITGATSLTKKGSGTLTLNAANTYSGGTAVSAGVVNAGGAGSFGSGKIALSGGELNLGAYAVTNAVEATGGKLSGTAYNGKLTVTGDVKLGTDTTANSVELVSGSLSEGSLTNTTVNATAGSIGSRVTGTSTVNVNGDVTLSGANTYTGRTTLSGGTLTAGSITAFGTGLVVVDAGTLNLGGYAVSNTVNAQSGTLTNGGAYAGTLNVNGNVALGGATTAAAVVLNSGSLTGGTLTSQAITAKGGTLGSKLTGACNVDIAGTVSLTGANDYTGRTTVSSGQLNVGNAGALGTSTVALKGGVLNLNGTAAGNAVTATAGTLSGATAYTGALTVKGNLTLDGVTTAGSISLEEGSISGGSIKDTALSVTQGSIDSSFAGAVSLQATNWALDRVLNNTGVLTMGGSIDASALQLETEGTTFVDVNGNKGTSGFARTAAYAVKLVNGGSTVNNQLTVKHGELDMVLGTDGIATAGGVVDYNTYYLNDSTASVSAIHGVEGASSATITQNGGTLTVDDTVTVTTTGGTIVLNGGALNGTVSGATINATSGALNAALSGNNTLNGNNYALGGVIANSGALTVSGTINAAALTLDTTAATHIDVNGNSGTSGFAKDAIYAVTIANGTTANSGATITHGEHTLTLGTDGVAKTGGAIDYSEYLLTGSAAASTSAIHAKGASATVTQNGGTLMVDDAVTVTTTGGTIVLNSGALNGTISGATINATSGALNATLSGNNTLNGTNYALQSVIANSGALTVSGTINAAALTLDTTAATHIDVNGNSGTSGFAKDAIYAVTLANGTTVNSGATITHGEHTLTLGTDGVAKTGGAIDYSEYLLTGSATAATSAIHAKGAAATVTQNGGTLTVDDTVTVNGTGGAITLNGGTLNGSLQGMTIDAVQGTLAATLTGNNTLIGHDFALNTPLDNQGMLTLQGSFDVSGMTPTITDATHIDVNGNSGNSGFAKSELQEVTIATGGNVNASEATFTHNGNVLEMGENGVASSGGEVDYSNYLLTGSDTASSSAIHGVEGAANATVTQNGGTLTVDDTVTVATTAGTIVLNGGTLNGTVSGATINATSGELNAALSGENTLNGNNYALGSVIDNSGTLTFSGTFDASALTLDTTAATHIDVNGNSGANGFAKDAFYAVTLATGTTVNAGATITHGSHTLTLGADGMATAGGTVDYGTYFLHSGAEVAVSAIRSVPEAADAMVDMDGGLLDADADVFVKATGGRIEVSHGANVAGSIRDTQIAIHGCEISADITGNSSVYVDGDTILSGHNTYTGNTDVVDGGMLKVTGSVTADIYLHGGMLDTATGMTLVSGQDIFFRGGQVKGNLRTVSGSGMHLAQSSTVNGSVTLGGGTLTLSNGATLHVTGSLTLAAPTQLVGDWQQNQTYTLISTNGGVNADGVADLNSFFGVEESVGTVKVEGKDVVLSTIMEAVEENVTPDAVDKGMVNASWAALATVRDFARVAGSQRHKLLEGNAFVWGSGFGSFMKVNSADGFSNSTNGYAAGVQYGLTGETRIGAAIGQSVGQFKTKFHREGTQIDQKGLFGAVTLQHEEQVCATGDVLVDVFAAYGHVKNEGKLNGQHAAGRADWTDSVLNIGGRLSYAQTVDTNVWVIPFVGLEWLYGKQGSTDTTDGRRYEGDAASVLRLPVGITLRASYETEGGSYVVPEVTFGYEGDLVQHNPKAQVRNGGKEYTTEGYAPARSQWMMNVGLNVYFDAHWSAGAGYTLESRPHALNQNANVSVRYAF